MFNKLTFGAVHVDKAGRNGRTACMWLPSLPEVRLDLRGFGDRESDKSTVLPMGIRTRKLTKFAGHTWTRRDTEK